MVRLFLVPSYDRWVAEVRAVGCKLIFMDSDGHIGESIPIWIAAGINCCGPVEVAAGNDVVEYRRRFGEQMTYVGGIDKRAIAAGGETTRPEVVRVVPPLLERGGCSPCREGRAESPRDRRDRKETIDVGGGE